MKLNNVIERRYSPMKFIADKSISEAEWNIILEAGRWAPSAYNEQPWRFIWANRNDSESFNRILSLLTESNQKWAADAQVIVITVASEYLAYNGKFNTHAWYDTGMATIQMVLQATSMGMQGHQMSGFNAELAQKELAIPERYKAVTAVAFGYADSIENVLPQFKKRAEQERIRKPISEISFKGMFGS